MFLFFVVFFNPFKHKGFLCLSLVSSVLEMQAPSWRVLEIATHQNRKVMAAFASSHCGFDPLSSRFSANFGGCEPLDTHSVAVTEEGFRPAAGIGQDLAAPAAGIEQDLAAFSFVQCWNKADPVDVNTSPFHYCA